uniref:ABC transporter domain-containing protein n=1 Tax=Daucus carota subsp. sativus TaxID=79200 RepID=A0A164XMZ5_DAUCS
MGSPLKVPAWSPGASPTRTLLLEFMTSEKDPPQQDIAPDPPQFYHNQTALTNFPFTNGPCPTFVPQTHQIRNASCHEARSLAQYEQKRSGKNRSSRVSDIERVESAAREDGSGIHITWKDVWVTVPSKKGGRRPILQGLTGYVEPGQSLAIMGPSGCGKSTLLDTLAAMRNPSDHFLRTINRDFDTEDEQTLNGGQTAAEAINILVKAFQSSEHSLQVQNRVSEICQMNVGTVETKKSQASFFTQCLVLTKRSFLNMNRDLGYYWLRLIVYITLALCIGTLFRNVGHTYGSIQARGSMLMFIAAFLTFMAIGGFPSFVEDMKIFTRERLNGHYGVAAFVVANTFSSLPFLSLIGLIPGVISYYLVGLQKEFGHFVYYALLIFVCMMLVESLMMVVASVVPDFLMGIITGAGIQGIMILNGGFFRLPDDMPKPFWKYPMYYISFHKYAFEGFYKNEYIGLSFPNEKAGGPPRITGDEILQDIWQVENGYSKWVDMTILLLMVATYRILFFLIIKGVEKFKPVIRDFLSNISIKQQPYSEDSLQHQQESSVRTVRAFSVLDCKCYQVDVTFRD